MLFRLSVLVIMCLIQQFVLLADDTAAQIEKALGERGIAHDVDRDGLITVQVHRDPIAAFGIIASLNEVARKKIDTLILEIKCDDRKAAVQLASLAELREIHVSEGCWHPWIAELLSQSKTIHSLWAGGSGLRGDDLKLIGKATQLECLMIDGNEVKGKDLVHLRDLTKLRQLSLSGSGIGTKDVHWLSSNERLSALWLGDTNVDDSIVAVLTPCKKIQLLSVPRTGVTSKGAKQLREQHPKAIVSAGGRGEVETIAIPNE